MRAGCLMESVAMCAMLGVGLCADSLGTTPGGFAVMAGVMAGAFALFWVGQHIAYLPERERTRSRRKRRSGRGGPEHTRSKTPAEGKKKAAAVVATPRRQVKQSDKAIISHPDFNGKTGGRQDGI